MPAGLNEDSAASAAESHYVFNIADLAQTYRRALDEVRRKHPIHRMDFALPEEMLTKSEKRALKQMKQERKKEVDSTLQAMLEESQTKELGVLTEMLIALAPFVDFRKGALFTPEHPILASHQFPYRFLIRESKHQVGEWRVEILDPKPLGEGSTGVVYNSLWVLKVRPQKLALRKPGAIYDIKNSNKVVKSFSLAEITTLAPEQSIIFEASQQKIDDELKFAQRFTGKGQRYLNLDSDILGSSYYLILQKALGKPLNLCTEEIKALDYLSAVFLAHQLLRSAAAIHEKGFVHADIKPENIVVDTTRNNLQAELIDFSACVPIGFKQTVIFGSPIIALPEMIAASRQSPYTVDTKTDSPSLAAALGILFGGAPFKLREQEQNACSKKKATLYNSTQRIAQIPYDFSNLFSQLSERPAAAKQELIRDLLEKMNGAVREERMTAAQAMHALEALHPELGVEVWTGLEESMRRVLHEVRSISNLHHAFNLFEPLFLQLRRFVARKNEGINTENPITHYHHFMGELISMINIMCDDMKTQAPSIAMQWCKILLDHFHQPQLVSFFDARPFLLFRAEAAIQAVAKKENRLHPEDTFLHNMIFLVAKELKKQEMPSVNVVKFLEDYYHSKQFTIKRFFSIFYQVSPEFKQACLIALINNQSLSREQKQDLESIISSTVAAIMHPDDTIGLKDPSALALYIAIQKDPTDDLCQAIMHFSPAKNMFQTKRPLLSALQGEKFKAEVTKRKVLLVAPSPQIVAPVSAGAVASEETSSVSSNAISAAEEALAPHDLAASNAQAARILQIAGTALFAPGSGSPRHFRGTPPAPPMLSDTSTAAVDPSPAVPAASAKC